MVIARRIVGVVLVFVVGVATGAWLVLAHGDSLGTRLVSAGMTLTNAGTPPVWSASIGTAVQLAEQPTVPPRVRPVTAKR